MQRWTGLRIPTSTLEGLARRFAVLEQPLLLQVDDITTPTIDAFIETIVENMAVGCLIMQAVDDDRRGVRFLYQCQAVYLQLDRDDALYRSVFDACVACIDVLPTSGSGVCEISVDEPEVTPETWRGHHSLSALLVGWWWRSSRRSCPRKGPVGDRTGWPSSDERH
jgi:hypothetical protein